MSLEEALKVMNRCRQAAIVGPKAYDGILTTNNRTAALKAHPSGPSASRMNARQFGALRRWWNSTRKTLPDDIARWHIEQINQAGCNVWFVWAVGTKPGNPHYYRVQTSAFMMELDMTQKPGRIHRPANGPLIPD